MVKQSMHPQAAPLDVRGKGFVIDPRDWSMTTEAGGGQYGLSFDPTGRLFTCTNSSHCEVFMYDAKYAARNPYVTLPDPRISIAADGPAAEVFRISPEEPWRVIRTRWRVAGLVGGPVEGGGRSAGYFTGATGITIYKGDAFGPDYVGDAFIGDAGGNLVHHKRIRQGPDGIEPIAQRPDDEKKIEFVASTDNWFRPVDFANSPDGCLYICDMYRETIEHPWSIPPQIKQFLDLNSGNDRGRIYRIAPDGWKPRPTPRLSEVSTAELAKALEHPNGWHRETAARLLFERHDPHAIPLVAKLLETSRSPLARLQALYTLDSLGALNEQEICGAMDDLDPLVRSHAIGLSERFLKARVPPASQWNKFQSRADDADIRVLYQLAFTLGEVNHPERATLLTKLARRHLQSRWMRSAILCAAEGSAGDLLKELVHDAGFKAASDSQQLAFVEQLAEVFGADGGKLTDPVTNEDNDLVNLTIASGFLRGSERAGHALDRDQLGGLLAGAAVAAQDQREPVSIRQIALSILAYGSYNDVAPILAAALHERMESLQLAGLGSLDRFDSPGVAQSIVRNFAALSLRAKRESVAVLLRRPQRSIELLDAIQAGSIKQSDLDASQVNQLLNSKNDDVRALAQKLLSAPATQRSTVVESFRPALSLKGDAAKGKLIYEQRCISCHRAGGEGNLVGPDLVTVKNTGAEKLLLNILDPSREVAANYINYLIETKDGQSVLGILASDSPSAITVRQAYAKETVIPREQIKR